MLKMLEIAYFIFYTTNIGTRIDFLSFSLICFYIYSLSVWRTRAVIYATKIIAKINKTCSFFRARKIKSFWDWSLCMGWFLFCLQPFSMISIFVFHIIDFVTRSFFLSFLFLFVGQIRVSTTISSPILFNNPLNISIARLRLNIMQI